MRFVLFMVLLSAITTPAVAETVLERVLERLALNGMFANVAQSGLFGSAPTTVRADIQLIVQQDVAPMSEIAARTRSAIRFDDLSALGIGATNSGDLLLGAGFGAPDGADIQDPRDLAASKILTFQNMGGEYASVGQTVASRIRIAPLGTIADQSHLVMNAATNVSRVNARIDTLTRNVSLQIDDIQSTAIGAVNTGLARIVGH